MIAFGKIIFALAVVLLFTVITAHDLVNEKNEKCTKKKVPEKCDKDKDCPGKRCCTSKNICKRLGQLGDMCNKKKSVDCDCAKPLECFNHKCGYRKCSESNPCKPASKYCCLKPFNSYSNYYCHERADLTNFCSKDRGKKSEYIGFCPCHNLQNCKNNRCVMNTCETNMDCGGDGSGCCIGKKCYPAAKKGSNCEDYDRATWAGKTQEKFCHCRLSPPGPYKCVEGACVD